MVAPLAKIIASVLAFGLMHLGFALHLAAWGDDQGAAPVVCVMSAVVLLLVVAVPRVGRCALARTWPALVAGPLWTGALLVIGAIAFGLAWVSPAREMSPALAGLAVIYGPFMAAIGAARACSARVSSRTITVFVVALLGGVAGVDVWGFLFGTESDNWLRRLLLLTVMATVLPVAAGSTVAAILESRRARCRAELSQEG